MSEPAQRVQLGYIAGAHGVRGALRIKLFNAESSTLEPGLKVELCPRGSEQFAAHEVARFAPKPGSDMARLWLTDVDSRDAADALRGRELWVERAQLPDLDEDEYYLTDLIGMRVVRVGDTQHEDPLGEVVGVSSNTVQELLCVRRRGREWLLPALPPFIVDIDLERGRVVVDVHDDMFLEA